MFKHNCLLYLLILEKARIGSLWAKRDKLGSIDAERLRNGVKEWWDGGDEGWAAGRGRGGGVTGGDVSLSQS